MVWLRTNTEVIPDSRVRSCVVLYVCLRSETITEGHMREHGGLHHGRSHAGTWSFYTRVPFVMFDGSGWVGGWWCGGVGVVVVVASVCPSSGQTHRTSIPTVVVSLTTHDNVCVYMYMYS